MFLLKSYPDITTHFKLLTGIVLSKYYYDNGNSIFDITEKYIAISTILN